MAGGLGGQLGVFERRRRRRGGEGVCGSVLESESVSESSMVMGVAGSVSESDEMETGGLVSEWGYAGAEVAAGSGCGG